MTTDPTQPSDPVPPNPTPPPSTPPPAAPAASAPTSVSFDRSKVGTNDLALGGAAVLFLIALLLPWLSISAGPISQSFNGFNSGKLTFAWILLIAAAALALLPAMGVNLNVPNRGLILVGLTGLALLLTLIDVIDVLSSTDDIPGADVSAGIGTWLGLLVGIAAVAVAVMSMRGKSVDTLRK